MMRLFEIIAIGVYAQIMRLHVIDRPDFAIMQIIGKFRNSLFNFTKQFPNYFCTAISLAGRYFNFTIPHISALHPFWRFTFLHGMSMLSS